MLARAQHVPTGALFMCNYVWEWRCNTCEATAAPERDPFARLMEPVAQGCAACGGVMVKAWKSLEVAADWQPPDGLCPFCKHAVVDGECIAPRRVRRQEFATRPRAERVEEREHKAEANRVYRPLDKIVPTPKERNAEKRRRRAKRR